MKKMTIYLSDELHKKIKIISTLEDKSMKDLIINAVEKEINKWEETKSKVIYTVFNKKLKK
jgi:predicted transcriptional regulator